MAGIRISFLSIFAFLTYLMNAQIVWLENSYDFGLMKEENGPVEGSVRFVNRGSQPAVVTGARPSCGCTGVEYSELPVAPGDTATIRFSYNPDRLPGKFDKSIKVYISSMGEEETHRIKIRGNVLGSAESLSELYPYESGALRFYDTRLDAGELSKGATRSLYLKCYNQSLDTITPKILKTSPALLVKSSEQQIGPGDVAVFAIFFDSAKVEEVGSTEIPITIISDSSVDDSPKLNLKLTAKITPDFSALSTDAVEKGPRCYLLPDRIDLGIITGDSPKMISFMIQNQGKSKMDILRISPLSSDHTSLPNNALSSSTTSISNENEILSIRLKKMPRQIKPGKTAEAVLTLLPSYLPAGPFRIPVEVYTDDPLHPVRLLYLVGQKE